MLQPSPVLPDGKHFVPSIYIWCFSNVIQPELRGALLSQRQNNPCWRQFRKKKKTSRTELQTLLSEDLLTGAQNMHPSVNLASAEKETVQQVTVPGTRTTA